MIKVGLRKPSLKKSIAARTKGRAKRALKKAIIPNYGKRGMGWAHPKKKVYNAVYSRTTTDSRKLFTGTSCQKTKAKSATNRQANPAKFFNEKNAAQESSISSNNDQQKKTSNTRYFKVKNQKDWEINRILYYIKIVRSCFLWFGVAVSVIGYLEIGLFPLLIWLVLKLPTLPFGEPIAPAKLKKVLEKQEFSEKKHQSKA